MRYPVKLNTRRVPAYLRGFIPNRWSPAPLAHSAESQSRADFSKGVTGLKMGTNWKTTGPGRHPATDRLILGLPTEERRMILDVGVSDGITSLELIENLKGQFDNYFVTDYCVDLQFMREGTKIHFYNGSPRRCVCSAGEWLVVYPDDSGNTLMQRLARALTRPAQEMASGKLETVSLVQPELRRMAAKDPRIVIFKYDMFEPWQRPRLNVIKIANLLNPRHFTAEQLTTGIRNLHAALHDGGLLFITDNREQSPEQVSQFRRVKDRFELVSSIEGGSEMEPIVPKAFGNS